MQSALTFPVGLNVDWQIATAMPINDHYLRNWLLDTGSLTERIQSLCRDFRVHRIGQGTAPLSSDEQERLGGKDSDYEVREVILFADDQPWVFARSVIPKALTEGEWKSLGSSPLGKLLFNDERFVRSLFEVAQLQANLLSTLPIDSVDHELFGRRSLFTLRDNKVLVAEVFLPVSPVYKNFYNG